MADNELFGNSEQLDDTVSRRETVKAIRDAMLAWSYMPMWREDKIVDAVKALPSAQSELRWIPVTERLPEPGEYYLVTRQCFGWNCTEYREIDIAKYWFDGWYKAKNVLAWCELPKPWEG